MDDDPHQVENALARKPIPTEIQFRVIRINEGGRRKLPFEKAALKVWFNESLIQTCKIRVIIANAYLL